MLDDPGSRCPRRMRSASAGSPKVPNREVREATVMVERGDDEAARDRSVPLYGVEGWGDDASQRVLVPFLRTPCYTGFSRGDKDLDPGPVRSISAQHRDGERQIDVSSEQAADKSPADLRRRTLQHARELGVQRDPGDLPFAAAVFSTQKQHPSSDVGWATVSILAESVSMPFAVAQLGDGWAAVGEGPQSIITISAHKVPLEGIRLVRLPDPPHLRHIEAQR